MNVFSALVDELKGIFGKGYVLAGLVPAAIVTVGWQWFRSGESLSKLFRDVTKLFAEDASAGVGELAALTALTLLTGLALFAARSALVLFAQRLPGRPLAPLRAFLLRRQVAKRERLFHRAELMSHTITVLRWAEKRFLEDPVYLPLHRRAVDVKSRPRLKLLWSKLRQGAPSAKQEILQQSGEAMEQALGTLRGPPAPPSRRQARRIFKGLELLYDLTYLHPASVKDDRSRWLAWAADERAAGVFEKLRARLERRWSLPRRDLEVFPPYNRMLPTLLGTRAAALDGYAEKRYGIDTSTLLARLWSVLDEGERKNLADNRLSIEVLVNLAVAMAILPVAVLVQSLAGTWPWRPPTTADLAVGDLVQAARQIEVRTVLFIVLPMLFAGILYRAAVHTYGAFAEKVVRSVDLKRLALIEELGFHRPQNVGEERELWEELRGFFLDGKPLDSNRPLHKKG